MANDGAAFEPAGAAKRACPCKWDGQCAYAPRRPPPQPRGLVTGPITLAGGQADGYHFNFDDRYQPPLLAQRCGSSRRRTAINNSNSMRAQKKHLQHY